MSLPLLLAIGPFRRFRVFLSYAREQRDVAEMMAHALNHEGHDAFLDRHDLPAGAGFHERIREAIERADLFVFLISPHSVEPGGYALTELSLAAAKWPRPEGRVLGVMVAPTEMERVDPYLKVNTILVPRGDVVAETVHAIDSARRPWKRRGALMSGGAAGVAAAAGVALYLGIATTSTPPVGPTALGGGDSLAPVDSAVGLTPLPLDSLAIRPDTLLAPADSVRPTRDRDPVRPVRPDPDRTRRPDPVVRDTPRPVRPDPDRTRPAPVVRDTPRPVRPVRPDTPRRVRTSRIDYYLAHADSLMNAGRLEEAHEALRRAYEASPTDPRIRERRARLGELMRLERERT